MTKVEIELSTLRRWFNKLEMHEEEDVTEEIFDAIKQYELAIESGKLEQQRKIQAAKDAIEPSIPMRILEIDKLYRIKKQPGFKDKYASLAGAQVKIASKARTKVSVIIMEPGNEFYGKQLKTDISSLTYL